MTHLRGRSGRVGSCLLGSVLLENMHDSTGPGGATAPRTPQQHRCIRVAVNRVSAYGVCGESTQNPYALTYTPPFLVCCCVVVGGLALITSHSQPFPVARFPPPPVAVCRCHFTQPYRSNFLLPFRSRFPYVHKQLLRVPVVDYVGWVGPWAKGVARQPPEILHNKIAIPGG